MGYLANGAGRVKYNLDPDKKPGYFSPPRIKPMELASKDFRREK